MVKLDRDTQKVLKKIYEEIKDKIEISISAPEYDQSQVDILVEKGLLQSIDVSPLEGWAYIVRATYQGETYFANLKNLCQDKIENFIKRGEEIVAKERSDNCGVTTVNGPMFFAWMSEINVFNEEVLKNHPLHDSIYTTFIQRNNVHAYDDMMGHLHALADDEILCGEKKQIKDGLDMRGHKTINQLLMEDIERCEKFLNSPEDENEGIDLYIEITGKYDSVIPNFGGGLYQYIEEQHFYDTEISRDTLIHNLRKLLGKMTSYQAINFSSQKNHITESQKQDVGNKVFIVHGHDEVAVLEMARTLENGGFEPVILHEQADSGLTIIEKIERYTDVDFAVVLYTECDLGRSKEDSVNDEKFRARQNVVFEHGYLISKLKRDHVCALVKGNVETPGDISGVVYVKMDAAGGWKMQLAKNLKAAGLNLDLNKFLG